MVEAAATLTEIRVRIDELDRELVGLLARREALVRQAAPLKSDARRSVPRTGWRRWPGSGRWPARPVPSRI
ncbi:chorismate mutase [Micromonospora vinacea]|uniref:chorismate mutase n=1 Tax=Micromonospora TaxID=1873 RepID=UPI00386605FD